MQPGGGAGGVRRSFLERGSLFLSPKEEPGLAWWRRGEGGPFGEVKVTECGPGTGSGGWGKTQGRQAATLISTFTPCLGVLWVSPPRNAHLVGFSLFSRLA